MLLVQADSFLRFRNHFACNINETVIRSTAQALVSTGLASVGYAYVGLMCLFSCEPSLSSYAAHDDQVNIDDCWASSRDANSNIVPDPKTFPSGLFARYHLSAYCTVNSAVSLGVPSS